jgi:hypothetical protein
LTPERLRTKVQRVAVGCGFRGSRGANIAAAARPVLDDDVLTPGLAELLRQDAAQRIDRTAGGERNQNAHGSVGIGLRACASVHRQRGRDQQQAAPDPQSHALLPIGFLFR